MRRHHVLLRGLRALGHPLAQMHDGRNAVLRAGRRRGGVPGREVQTRVVPVRLPLLGVLSLPVGEHVGGLHTVQAPPVPRMRGRGSENVPGLPGPAGPSVARAAGGAAAGTRTQTGHAGKGLERVRNCGDEVRDWAYAPR